jgi:WD40 repeat protein
MFPLPKRAQPGLVPTAARLERELKYGRPLIGCRFDPSGRFLFVSAEDHTLQRYDLLTGERTALIGHQSWVRGLAFVGSQPSAGEPGDPVSAWQREQLGWQAGAGFAAATRPGPTPTPFVLVSGDYHGNLIWWAGEDRKPKPLRVVPAHQGWVRAVVASPDGRMIASCGNDNRVKLWNAADGKPLQVFEGHTSHVYNLAFHPGGNRLASCDLKGTIKDWNLTNGQCERDLDAKVLWKYDAGFMADIGGARAMTFNAEGTTLLCTGITNVTNAFAGVGNPAVLLVDWKTGTAKLLKTKEAFQGTGWGGAFHPAGFVLAAGGGGGGGRVWFWTGEENVNSHTLTIPANARDLALAARGDQFAVAGANGTAYVYTFSAGPSPAPQKK